MEQVRMTSPQGAQGAQGTRGKPSAQGADQGVGAQAAGQGGFLSLLAALGDGGLQDPLAAQAGVLEMGVAEANDPAAADAAALAALQGGFLPWQVPDAGAAAGAQTTVGGLVADQGGMGNGLGVAGLGASLQGGLLPTDGLVAQTALQDRAAEALPDSAVPGSLLAPPAGGGRRMQSRILGAMQHGDTAIVAGAQSTALAGTKGHAAAPSLQAAVAPLQPVEHRGMVAASREAASSMVQDTVATLAPLVPGVVEGSPGGRALAQGAEPGARDPAGGAAGNASYEPQGGAVEGATAFMDPTQVATPAEDAVAEQVAFWVHQNIQNAEVTVKHDGKPVEVSVSLTGNEAHVAFRSDQAQTRDLLDASVSQLREMLRQEGLELSGVTVGDSGAQAGDGGSQRGQQGAPRNAQVAVPAAAGTRTRSGVDILSDRAVDLFV